MRPYFAKVSTGTGFEPALNWFQSTAPTVCIYILITAVIHILHDGRWYYDKPDLFSSIIIVQTYPSL